MIKILAIMLAILLQCVVNVNVVRNGGFDGYTLGSMINGERYSFIFSNKSLWYSKTGLEIEVKNKKYPPIGNAAQLCALFSYVLCQNIRLQVGAIYNLKFDMATSQYMSSATVTASINNDLIMNLSLYKQQSIISGQNNFTAKLQYSTLCFDPVYKIDNFFFGYLGPYVDNVTIVKIANATQNGNSNSVNYNSTLNQSVADKNSSTDPNPPDYWVDNTTQNQSEYYKLILQIYCHSDSDSQKNWQQIVYKCSYKDKEVQMLLNMFKGSLQIYFDDDKQKQIEVSQFEDFQFTITLKPQRNYYLPKVSIVVALKAMVTNSVSIQFFVNGIKSNVIMLSSNLAETVYITYNIASNVMGVLQKSYAFLRASFLSFFLTDIICFWNLSLMYNLLKIDTVPQFSKYFLQKLTYLFFNLNSVIKWLTSNLPGNLNTLLDFSNKQGNQKMTEFKNNFAWFGSFGMSSGFMKNNTQQVLTIVFLLLKLTVVRILACSTYFQKLTKKIIPTKQYYLSVFLNQFIPLQIFIIISAVTDILQPGYLKFDQKLNAVIQISIIFLIITSFPLLFLNEIKIQRRRQFKKIKRQKIKQLKKQNSQKNEQQMLQLQNKVRVNPKQRKALGKSSILMAAFRTFQYLPFFFIPFTIIFNSSILFLFINTLLIGGRLCLYLKYHSVIQKSLSQKVFYILNLIIWIIHHSTYLLFFVLQKIYQKKQLESQIQIEVLKYCGLITIFTVLIGGILEILKFVLSILLYILKKIKKMVCPKKKDQNELQKNEQETHSKKQGKQDSKSAIKIKTIYVKKADPQSQNNKHKKNESHTVKIKKIITNNNETRKPTLKTNTKQKDNQQNKKTGAKVKSQKQFYTSKNLAIVYNKCNR